MPAPVTSVKQYFDTLPERFQAAAAKGIHATFQFELSGEGGGTYHAIVHEDALHVEPGPAESPTVVVKMAAGDYIKMSNGELNGQLAFMKGQLKVTGNLLLAQKMQAIFPAAK